MSDDNVTPLEQPKPSEPPESTTDQVKKFVRRYDIEIAAALTAVYTLRKLSKRGSGSPEIPRSTYVRPRSIELIASTEDLKQLLENPTGAIRWDLPGVELFVVSAQHPEF